MHENSLPDGGPDGRAAPRTNLFMAARLHAAGGAHAVKIRDLSAVGAQIESSLFPEVGSAMTLVRGRLSVQGHVAWSTERRCGLHFSTRISVPDWMANPINLEQQRVDHLVAVVKAGGVPYAAPDYRQAGVAQEIAEDLKGVAQLLEMLGDALAGDPAIVTGHGVTLQNLDIAAQTLTALAGSTHADSSKRAASMVRLADLRINCAQALESRT